MLASRGVSSKGLLSNLINENGQKKDRQTSYTFEFFTPVQSKYDINRFLFTAGPHARIQERQHKNLRRPRKDCVSIVLADLSDLTENI